MAYTSFSLRRTITDGGSALRRTNVSQDASDPTGSGDAVFDSGLRADGYTPLLPIEALESTFSAEIYKRGEIELTWQLASSLVVSPAGEAYEPTALMIRASDYGEPVTPQSGIGVLEITALDYIEAYVDVASPARPYIAEGKWAYYSMFVKYTSSVGGSFYEKVAELSVQTPYDFGSFQALWSRVPTYYRELDYTYALNDPDSSVKEDPDDPESPFVGPLYRFVELFAWELDKVRTTIFDTMRINDPEVVHSSAIDALAYQVGVTLTKDALGTDKLRSLLNNIGYLRRTKGTIGSVEAFISALSGCGVTSTYNTVEEKWIFDVHPMRVNLFPDPFFDQAITSGPPPSGTNYQKWVDGVDGTRPYGWGVFIETTSDVASELHASSSTLSTSGDKLTLTLPTSATNDAVRIIVYGRCPFPFNSGLNYYGSITTDYGFIPRLIPSSSIVGLESTVPPLSIASFLDWGVWGATSAEEFETTSANRKVYSFVQADNPVSGSVIPAYQFEEITLSDTDTTVVEIKDPLFEYRNSSGEFFSGSSTNGGYIPNALGGAGDGIYDYHWGTLSAASAPGTDFSYYTLDIYRVQRITEDIIETSVIPVNKVKNVDYEINWEVLE